VDFHGCHSSVLVLSFFMGVHLRVGEIQKADELLAIKVVHEIHKVLSWEWSQATTSATKK
jgi:hypothetical protein